MNPNTIGQGALSKAARNLLDTVRAAINAGDWKVDGACDPDASVRRLEAALAADAESERRYPINEIVADPLGEKGSAHTDEYGYEECARRGFAAGVEWATGAKPGAAQHDLYKRGDKDVPAVILDANGDVVLGLCKRCGRGEIELEEPCVPRNLAGKAAIPDLTDDEWVILFHERPDLAERLKAALAKSSWIDRARVCAAQIARDILSDVEPVRGEGVNKEHLRWMADQLALRQLKSETKACRWLGYLQGSLVAQGLSTLEIEKKRNLESGQAIVIHGIDWRPGSADDGAQVLERTQRPLASVAGAKVVHDGPSEAMLQLPDGRVIRLEQLGVGHGMWGTPEDNDALCEAFASFTEHLDQGVRVTHVDHRSPAGRAARQRDAFLDQVRAAREVWIEEASENGTPCSEDVVTPFDRFLYDPPQA